MCALWILLFFCTYFIVSVPERYDRMIVCMYSAVLYGCIDADAHCTCQTRKEKCIRRTAHILCDIFFFLIFLLQRVLEVDFAGRMNTKWIEYLILMLFCFIWFHKHVHVHLLHFSILSTFNSNPKCYWKRITSKANRYKLFLLQLIRSIICIFMLENLMDAICPSFIVEK